MTGWIIALPREDMEHCIKTGVFGMNRKWVLGSIREGDPIVCYVTKEKKIIALGHCTAEYYLDDSKIFLREGSFIDRIKFKAEKIPIELDFQPLVDDMQFIKNKKFWQVFSKFVIFKITDADFENIRKFAGAGELAGPS